MSSNLVYYDLDTQTKNVVHISTKSGHCSSAIQELIYSNDPIEMTVQFISDGYRSSTCQVKILQAPYTFLVNYHTYMQIKLLEKILLTGKGVEPGWPLTIKLPFVWKEIGGWACLGLTPKMYKDYFP